MTLMQAAHESDQEIIKRDVPRLIVIMGVSGAGKTTIGNALAEHLGTTFIDGDSYHPRANVEKMSRGEALTDRDRMPWLALIAGAMRGHVARSEQAFKKQASQDGVQALIPEGCSVAACSALRRSYREYLTSQAGEEIFYVFLQGTKELIHSRMLNREGHFMPSQLLDSQFATLEQLESDEGGLTVNVESPVQEIVEQCVAMVLSGRND